MIQEAIGKASGNSSECSSLNPPVPGRHGLSVCTFLESGVQRTPFWASLTDWLWMCTRESWLCVPALNAFREMGQLLHYRILYPTWHILGNSHKNLFTVNSPGPVLITLYDKYYYCSFYIPKVHTGKVTMLLLCLVTSTPPKKRSWSNADTQWLWNLGYSLSPREQLLSTHPAGLFRRPLA